MISYETSVLQSQIDTLKLFVVISLILIVLLFYLGKRLSETIANNQMMIAKINRDNELKYENLVDVVCPSQIKLKKCEQCNSSRQECWKEYFIEKLKK